MKKLIIIISLLFCSSVSAEWVFFLESKSGVMNWYEDKRIRVRGDNVLVWSRTRYPENKKIGGEVGSSTAYNEINCNEYSYQYLQVHFYADFECVAWLRVSSSACSLRGPAASTSQFRDRLPRLLASAFQNLRILKTGNGVLLLRFSRI